MITAKTPLLAATAFLAAAIAWGVPVGAAEFIMGSQRAQERAYSPAVITEGGRIVWLAGMGGSRTADGKPIVEFAEQARQAFRNIEATVKRAGGTLQDLVTMTVFIRNQSDGDEFVKIRAEVFKNDFPASALITAKDFANPDILVEIQSIAVIGERN
jgi:enamine deaminase RidA (YjgF/YER057c/UK114 family)